jgi:hypothetical protein
MIAGLGLLAGMVALGPHPATPEPAPQETASAPAPELRLTEPLDLVPAESLLCWYGRPFPDTSPVSGDPSYWNTFMQLFPKVLDAQSRLYARVIEAFSLAIRYPHALAFVDARALPVPSDPSIRRVDKLRLALVVQVGDQPQAEEAFARVLQAAVNEQTDSQFAKLQRRQAGNWEYQELTDSRLPDWCAIAWGRIGPHFVLTIGPDVWPLIASVATGENMALGRTEWLAQVRGPRSRAALIEIILAAQTMRERLDPFVNDRVTEFFAAWDAEELQHAHWALGFEGQAMYCVAHYMENGQVRERVYADPAVREAHLLAVVPDKARYAIYRVEPTEFVPRFFAAMLTTESTQTRKTILRVWEGMKSEFGFDGEQDILAHLGPYTVMHNYPQHPLHIPLAMTTLTEIRDEPQRVKEGVDRLCRAWQTVWDRDAEKSGKPPLVRVCNDGKGIWYLQYPFLAGTAWTVTDRFIITSWSPVALRTYLEQAGDHVGRMQP